MAENYLIHHGILGQKWGIRRYQNYDGTYTQAGMKRYNASLDEYNKKLSDYKESKKSDSVSKGELTNKKVSLKKAKRKLDKDYKHLKQDKLADKGKNRYANGETITGHKDMTALLSGAGVVAVGSQYLSRAGILDQKVANIVTVGSVSAVGASYAKRYLYDAPRDRQLRAYYGHTSKY